MTRYPIRTLLFAALVHLFSPGVACAEPNVIEPTAVPTANETNIPSAAPSLLSAPADITTYSSPPQRIWYGETILGVDAVAAGLVAVSVASSSGILLIGSGLVYTLGGPIIHGTHHNDGKALASLGLRVALPVVGGVIGAYAGASASQGCTGEMCGLGGVFAGGALGLGVGMVAASVIDIAFLAYESTPDSAGPRVALLPAIDPNKRSASLTLQGTW